MGHDELFGEAERSLSTAEYLLMQTYPGLKDNKLFLTVIEHLLMAADYGITSALEYERGQHTIPAFNKTNFTVKVETFRRHLAERYGVDRKEMSYLLDLQHIRELHKTAPVEFARKDRYVLANDDYRMEVLTEKKVRTYKGLVATLLGKIRAQVSETK